jgi:endonuclease-8
MPEGPEVRRAADRLSGYVVGQPLVDLALPDWIDADTAALRDSGIIAVRTHGKLMWVEFGTGHALTIHLQLYGRWRFGRKEPAMSRSRRAAFVGPKGGGWLYSATDVHLLPPGVLPERPRGLDPLHPETTAAALATRLLSSPRRQLGGMGRPPPSFGLGDAACVAPHPARLAPTSPSFADGSRFWPHAVVLK